LTKTACESIFKPEAQKFMRKEIFFALLTGIAFGLVVAFGVWRANYKTEPSPEEKQTTTSENKEKPQEKEVSSGLTILKPEENELLNQDTVVVEGITEPNAKVVISAEDKDYLTNADQNGGISQEIKLTGGVNEILITAFTQKGEVNVLLPVVYSKEFKK